MDGLLRQRARRSGSAPLLPLLPLFGLALCPLPPALAREPAETLPPAAASFLASDPLLLDPQERQRFRRSADPDVLVSEVVQRRRLVAEPSPWAGTLELYGFLPLRTTNQTTIGGFTAESTLSLGQLLEVLTGTFSFRGSVEHGRLGLLTDISYVNLGKQAAIERSRDRIQLGDGRILGGLEALRNSERRRGVARNRLAERLAKPGEVDRERGALAAKLARRVRGDKPITSSFRTELSADQGIYDLALRYRLGARESAVAEPGTVTVIPYAGIRLLDLGLNIESSLNIGGFKESAVARSWGSPQVQPLLGTQAQVFVAPRLRLFARGDAAGFGISGSDSFSANAQVGVGYAIGNSTQLDLSWRYLHMAANNGKDPENAYVIGQNGLELGLKVFF
jgi:hypothetical protein